MDTPNPQKKLSTARGRDGDNNLIVPGLPNIKYAYLVNVYEQYIDIKDNIKSFSIIEDLYSPILKANISIRDNVNLFQDFQINGSEMFEIEIEIDDGLNQITILKLDLHIHKVTRYEKTKDAINVSEIDMELVNRITYASSLSKICKGIHGDGNGGRYPGLGTDPYLEIKDIFRKLTDQQKNNRGSLIYENETKSELQQLASSNFHDNITRIQGNITRRSPLAAIEFLRTKCWDISFSPFFIFHKLSRNEERESANRISTEHIYMASLSDLIEDESNPIYYATLQKDQKNGGFAGGRKLAYKYTDGITDLKENPPGTSGYYNSQKIKILSIDSVAEMNQLKKASTGGYGNELQIVDYLRKDMVSKQFNPGVGSPAPPKFILKQFLPAYSSDDYTAAGDNRIIPFANILFNKKSIATGIEASPFSDASNVGGAELFKQKQMTLHLPSTQYPTPEFSDILVNTPDAGEHNDGQADLTYRTAPELYAHGLNMVKYYYGQLDTRQALEIMVHGDTNLNPGVRIVCEIVRSSAKQQAAQSAIEDIDENLSGIYLITTAIHNIKDGVYTTRMRVIKIEDREDSKLTRGKEGVQAGLDKILLAWQAVNGESPISSILTTTMLA